jgi:tetratricopeptide (TPR) repeat protein
LRSQKKLTDAETLGKEAMTVSRRGLGESHPYSITAINNQALVLRDQGRLGEAEPLMRKALALSQRVLGEKHPATQVTRQSLRDLLLPLGDWLDTRGRFAEAEKSYREMLEVMHREQQTEKVDASTLIALVQQLLLTNLVRQEKYTEAEPLARKCREILDQRLPDEWVTFEARSLHGACLLGQKKYAEAEPLLRHGYNGLKRRRSKIPPAQKPRLTEAVERLVRLYTEWKKPDEEARWRKELEAMRKAAGPSVKPGG